MAVSETVEHGLENRIAYSLVADSRYIQFHHARKIADRVSGQVDVRDIEMPEVAEEEPPTLEDDTADADDVIHDAGDMDETD